MSFLRVPTEILIEILSYDCVAISDVCHLMCSCREMNQIIQDLNKLWKKKFTTRWPCVDFQVEDTNKVLWKERVHLRIRLGKEIKEIILSMSALCYPNGVQAFTPQSVVDKLEDLVNQNVHFVEDEIKKLAFESGSLTTHYYAVHMLEKVRTPIIQKKWLNLRSVTSVSELFVTEVDFNAGNINAQTESKPTRWIEEALLLTQWLNTKEKEMPSFINLENGFDRIIQRVKSLVMDRNHISNKREILTTISHVLFNENEMNFVPISEFFTEADHGVYSFCIDKVFLAIGPRKCHMTILCIIYQEVARRMGIDVEPVIKDTNNPEDPLDLRWHEFPEDGEGYTFIDVHDKGSLKRPNPSPYSKYAASVVTQIGELIHHMIWRALDSFYDYRVFKYIKLVRAFDPYGDLNEFEECCLQIALSGECELEELLILVQSCRGNSSSLATKRDLDVMEKRCRALLDKAKAKSLLPVLPKHRPSTLKYAVGLVVSSETVNTEPFEIQRKSGVIVSWKIVSLSTGNQPHPLYTVLLLDESQETLQRKTYDQAELNLHPYPSSVRFDHPELGIHFEEFDGRRFVPNAEKKRHFPEDEAVAMSLIGN